MSNSIYIELDKNIELDTKNIELDINIELDTKNKILPIIASELLAN